MNSKNILTVAPFLADDFVEPDEVNFDVEQYQNFISDNKYRLGLFGKYLICKFHDSWIIETKITDNLFSVTLNDYSTYVFADSIIERNNLPIDADHIAFPIQLDFKTNDKVKFFKVDDDGSMIEVPEMKLDEYLYEQVLSIGDEKVDLAFTFWKSNLPEAGERIILLVSATEISVLEKQDAAWQKTFGSTYNDYYQYFKKQFDSDRYVSDHNKSLELIEEWDAITTKY